MRVLRLLGLLALVVWAIPAAGQTCAFSLTPISANYNAAGGNDIVTLTVTSGGQSCSRTAVSNATWITISFGQSGAGDGTVGYTVQSNPFTVARTGTITIAGQTFTVNQAAGTCTYALSPSSASVSSSGGTGSFNLTASSNSCTWSAVSSATDWLSVSPASGGGSTTVRYTAAPNTTTSSRSGSIAVGGQNFTVTQSGVCSISISPVSATAGAAGATGTITLTASASSCAWTATSSVDWLTISAVSGAGSGSIIWTAAANATGQDRTASIAIAGAGFTLLQSGACSYSLSNNQATFPSSGGSGSFLVTSACAWTASTTSSWIAVTYSPTSGVVSYQVAGNTDSASRTGFITVGNQTYSIIQAGVACSVTLTALSATAPASGGSGSFHVTAGGGCSWTAATVAGWITLANNSGASDGDVTYTVAANTNAQQRIGVVTVANQRFAITQDAATCAYAITPAQAAFQASGGTGVLHLDTACSWSVTITAAWIALGGVAAGTGSADIAYSVARNTSSDARSATIRISGQTVTITQSGKDCSVAATPNTVTLKGRGDSVTVTVNGSQGCRWEPAKDSPWISIPSWSAVDGSGSVTIAASANSDPAMRYGSVAIAGQTISVAQGGLEVLTSREGVLNAASFVGGAVAPGEIVTVFGASLGPAATASYQLTSDRQHLSTAVQNVRVTFDGVPAPLLYVSAGQLSAIVPYTVTGKTTQMVVTNQGVASTALPLDVASSSPAFFTANVSGKGQAAVLNQDNSVNSASNAAARNSIVQMFATGEGLTTPAGEDGRLASGATLPKPQLPVTVTIGGQAATIAYAGAAPGMVAGLLQVNARIPQNVTPGSAVAVVLKIGQATSPSGVTIAVK